jgi:WD40 repeat protein
MVLTAFLLACAANTTTPARAEPRAAVLGAPRAAAVSKRAIDASNVERVKLAWEVLVGDPGRAVAISRKLRLVAFGGESGVRHYDARTGNPGPRPETCGDVIRGGLSFHENRLVIVCAGGVTASEVMTRQSSALPVHESKITAASRLGDKLALGHHDGVLRVYDLGGAEPLEIPVPGPPIDVKSMALSPDGKTLAVAWVQGSIWWWRLDQPGAFQRLVRHERESDAVAFSADGSLFAEEGKSRFTTVWSVSDPAKSLKEIQNGAWVKQIRFLGQGKWVARGGSDGLELAEVLGPKRIVLDTQGKVEDVALDEHGATLAAVDRMGRLTFYEPR